MNKFKAAKKALSDFNSHQIGEYELVTHFKAIREVLDKQIAKPITRKDMSESFKCPNCNEDRYWKDGKYCKDCGQLLDWRND